MGKQLGGGANMVPSHKEAVARRAAQPSHMERGRCSWVGAMSCPTVYLVGGGGWNDTPSFIWGFAMGGSALPLGVKGAHTAVCLSVAAVQPMLLKR